MEAQVRHPGLDAAVHHPVDEARSVAVHHEKHLDGPLPQGLDPGVRTDEHVLQPSVDAALGVQPLVVEDGTRADEGRHGLQTADTQGTDTSIVTTPKVGHTNT